MRSMNNLIHRKFPDSAKVTLKDGEVLFYEGDMSREMYIVQEGEVRIVREKNGKQVTIGTIKRGEFVGEMSLLESLPRSATAIAIGKVSLISLDPAGIIVKIRRDPTFAYEMMQQLSRRIRQMNEKIVALVESHNIDQHTIDRVVTAAEITPEKKVLKNDNAA